MDSIDLFNSRLFLAINGGAGSAPWLVDLAKAVGDGLIYLVPLSLVALWLKGSSQARGVAMRSFFVAMLALGINQLIGLFWQHPRPFVIGLGHAWIEHAPDSSFPSDHATILFALAFTLLVAGFRKMSMAALASAMAVAWARIFLGVHFPLDMAGAALVAALALVVLSKPWNVAGSKVTCVAESVYRRLFAWPISAGWMKG